jgi:hypothetical protein
VPPPAKVSSEICSRCVLRAVSLFAILSEIEESLN